MATVIECPYCGLMHSAPPGRPCSFIKAMEYDVGGNLVRVEFMTPMDLRLVAGEQLAQEADYPRFKPEAPK